MKIFNLPDLGEGLAEAEIHEWHIKEGDEVAFDEPIVSVETAKAIVDIPAPRSGKVKKLYGKATDIIKTGDPLLEFTDDDKKDSGTVVGKIQSNEQIIDESPTGVKPAKHASPLKIMPAARALAAETDIDLTSIKGSGPHGEITLKDIKRAGGETTGLEEPLRGVRRAMAQTMTKAHAEVVLVTLVDEVNIQAWKKTEDITTRILRAMVHACKEEPALNAHFEGKSLTRHLFNEVNIGLAIDSEHGLFVPVIHNAEKLSSKGLREQIDNFKERVQDRTIAHHDLQGASISLSNFGSLAGRYATPIVVPPCVAILGVGKLHKKIAFHNETLETHRVLPLSLSFDHRAVTGGEASRFLSELIIDLSCSI